MIDIVQTIVVTFCMGSVPQLILTVLKCIWNCILYLTFSKSTIVDRMHSSAIDRHFAQHAWCSSRSFDFSRMPGDGPHLLITWAGRWPTGLIVAYRKSNTSDSYRKPPPMYTLYWMGKGMESVRALIIGDPKAITLRSIYVPSPWRTSVAVNLVPPPEKPRAWQKTLVDRIITAYVRDGRASVLVCGPPGCGKSTLGELVAGRLKGLGIAPEVVKNMDLTTPNLLLEDAYDKPTPSSPIILMLDEFDGAANFAERDRSVATTDRGISLANTPTSLTACLDSLAMTKNLIVIATSNIGLATLEAGKYMRYTRAGRLDIHVSAKGCA